ncbi:MAG: hypothetical protein KC731_30320, partial [Myxococcales bacterium]|nr:hypothetical protein [Myxococcales bacterium]
WAAAQRGAALRLFDGGLGASCLAGGAVDDRPWDEVARSAEVLQSLPRASSLPEAVRIFADDLGLWRLPPEGALLPRLATSAGRTRLARGHDRALLDLATLPARARIALPTVSRPEWDADHLARALSADAYAESRALRFVAGEAKLLKHVGEDRIPPAELAMRHDDPDRRGYLVERLREMLARAGHVDAILLGPWLGCLDGQAEAIGEALGLPVGEILGEIGGAAGLRFEAARAALLDPLGIGIEPYQARRIGKAGEELYVELESGERVVSDRLVIAVGGVAAGGIVYDPPEQHATRGLPESGRVPWRLSIAGRLGFQARGRRLDVVGSIHGPALDGEAWPTDADPGLLECVGLATDGFAAIPGGELHGARIYAAGDVVADRPRTVLQAVFAGIHAGAAAGGEPGALSA